MVQKLGDAKYDSIVEFLDAANNDLVCKDNENMRDEYTNTGRHNDGWYGAGCKTGHDVQRKLKEGWPEGRKQCEDMLAKFDTSSLVPVDRRRRQIKTDMGDNLDMQAVYLGNLDTCWSVAKRQYSSGPQRVDIVANMLCSVLNNPSVLFWRGVAAVVLADKLEAAGYMVRIVVGFGGLHGCDEVSCRITVKDHGMPLDISTCAAVLMPGFFRAIGHGWIAGHKKTNCYSPGISVEQCKIEPGELVLSHSVNNEQTAMKWLQDQIAKLEAPQRDAA